METPVTPGWKTTEFWLSTAAMIVGAVLASGALPEYTIAGKLIGVAAMVLSALGYSVGRSMVKSAYLAPIPPPQVPGVPLAALASAQADAAVATGGKTAAQMADEAAR